jgi:translation initiation factor 2B subunit (eIF-2B alpha/beta/delta family)
MEFFQDIKENKEEGASSLLILALRKIEKFISHRDKVSPSDIFLLTSELKHVRPSMVIIRKYAEKIEKFLANFHENENIKSQIQDFIYQLIEEIREKRKKIVNQGIDIIRRYKKIAVVSCSSVLKEILDNFSDKKILAAYC